ncbi:DUF4843 domain-containing protein [Pedobacter frigidisoli]|uniref:DUF4843 domain-containing protein n=1 Tax=Pedobacter frigidisoli TaxID=2530455 RepID=UPI00292FAF70|nr:DUF4843 domain-containing protein [Pedobacter frigidisoli]
MRKLVIFSLLAMCMIFPYCKKTELKTYDGDTSLYFSVFYADPTISGRSSVQPFTTYSFFGIFDNVSTLKFRVNLTGKTENFDRKFIITLDKDSTTAVEGVDFEVISSDQVIKANASYADVPVTIKRTAAMKTKQLVIGLRLLPNENFKLSMPVWYPLSGQVSVVNNALFDARYHGIKVSDIPVAPTLWKTYGAVQNNLDAGYWGAFSAEKYYLMCEVCSLTYDDFTAAKMPASRALLMATLMKNYLQTKFNMGTPIKEADGRLMWFNGVSWRSTIGVPY